MNCGHRVGRADLTIAASKLVALALDPVQDRAPAREDQAQTAAAMATAGRVSRMNRDVAPVNREIAVAVLTRRNGVALRAAAAPRQSFRHLLATNYD